MEDGALNSETVPRDCRKISLDGQSGIYKADAIKGKSLTAVHLHT
jgi:hypothetical protein